MLLACIWRDGCLSGPAGAVPPAVGRSGPDGLKLNGRDPEEGQDWGGDTGDRLLFVHGLGDGCGCFKVGMSMTVVCCKLEAEHQAPRDP